MDQIQIQKIAAGQAMFDDQESDIEVEDEIDLEVSEEEPDEEV